MGSEPQARAIQRGIMKRRIIAALAAVGLTAAMAVGVAPAAQAQVGWGDAYVAVGDSVAAGTGNLPYTDVDCRRSVKAYPQVLAGLMGGAVTTTACFGDTTAEVFAQVTGLLGTGAIGPNTKLVTITVGVNDLPWIDTLGACSNLGTFDQCAGLIGGLVKPGVLPPEPSAQLEALGAGIAQLAAFVRSQIAIDGHVVVTGYPRLFGDFTGTCSVGSYGPGTPLKFAAPNAQLLNGAVMLLNAAIGGAVTGSGVPGVHFVDVTGGFAGHGLCDSGDRWISGLANGNPTLDKGFHPNVAGQQAYAHIIAAALAG